MRRRISILAAVVAATLAIGVIPALAADDDVAPRRHNAERTWPPKWIDQSADDLREAAAKRAAAIENRIEGSDRLTDEQKADVLSALSDTVDAIANLDEPAEIIGTVISRRQLQRIEWRAARNDETADYEKHIAGDLERFSLRLEHLTKIAGWAEAAGENTTAVTGYLDETSDLLEVAGGGGTVQFRHDAAHVARAWMTEASVALMTM